MHQHAVYIHDICNRNTTYSKVSGTFLWLIGLSCQFLLCMTFILFCVIAASLEINTVSGLFDWKSEQSYNFVFRKATTRFPMLQRCL